MGGAVSKVLPVAALAASFIPGVGPFVAIGLSIAGAILAPKPKPPSFGGAGGVAPPPPILRDRIFETRDPITPRETVYGDQRKSGQVLFRETSDTNKFYHIVVELAGHEVTGIDEVFLDNESIHADDMDGAGLVNTGKFNGKVRIKKHLGTDAQTVDTDLNGIGGWTASHRLRGIAYVYVRIEADQDLFATIPNISAWVRGKKVIETRDVGPPSLFSANPALILRDYLTTAADDMGAGFDATNEIDDNDTDAAANICDQEVTVTDVAKTVNSVDTTNNFVDFATDKLLIFQRGDKVDVTSTGSVPGGLGTGLFCIPYRRSAALDTAEAIVNEVSMQFATTLDNAYLGTAINITSAGSGTISVTKKAEPRYSCNGVVDSDRKPHDIVEEILATMGGRAVHVGGTWSIHAAGFNTPTLTFDEDDLRSPLQVVTRHPRRERFNAVKGAYVSPINNGIATDYPPVTNSTYETEDNSLRLFADLDLSMVPRAHQAMRLAKIELERHRQQITVVAKFSLAGLQVKPTDVINLDNTRMGWTGKDFEVTEFKLVSELDDEGVPALGVDLVLRETASAVFDWAAGEETSVDLAPNTNLPNPFNVSAPTSMVVVTEQFSDIGDGLHVRLIVTWATPTDFFVSEDGKIEVQFKRSEDAAFEPSFFVAGDAVQAFIPQVEDGKDYDIQIRAINQLGARSAFTQTLNYTAGSTFEDPSVRLDYRLVTESPTTLEDWGLVTETPAGTFVDYETIV